MTLCAKTVGVLFCLAVLAGCSGLDIGFGGRGSNSGGSADDWLKVGADPGETAREYRDCRDIAEDATRTDADIDQDIAATRGSDLQHSQIVQTRTAQMTDKTRGSSAAIIAGCMKQKGFYERR